MAAIRDVNRSVVRGGEPGKRNVTTNLRIPEGAFVSPKRVLRLEGGGRWWIMREKRRLCGSNGTKKGISS